MKLKRITQILMCTLLVCCIAFPTVACSKKREYNNETSALIVATQELDQMFNPFFATSGYDTSVVGMTQISMLSSDKDGNVYVGDDQPTVVKCYNIVQTDHRTDAEKDPNFTGDIPIERYNTEYTFVIKNGIKFSDGEPLTIEDILFNFYIYLDPAYTGSSTLYSTAIYGLDNYRAQVQSGDAGAESEALNERASSNAGDRMNRLIDYFWRTTDHPGADLGSGTGSLEENRAALRKDLETIKQTFKDELLSDWNGASASVADSIETYTTPDVIGSDSKKYGRFTHYTAKADSPDGKIKKDSEITSEIQWVTEDWQLFLVREGAVSAHYDDEDKDVCVGVDYSTFPQMVEKFKSDRAGAIRDYIDNSANINNDLKSQYHTMFNEFAELKDFLACLVFDSKLGGMYIDENGAPSDGTNLDVDWKYPSNIYENIDDILYYWVTGTTIRQQFVAEALSDIFKDRTAGREGLLVPSVEGITHGTIDAGDFTTGTQIIDNSGTSWDEKSSTVRLEGSHEVLKIKIEGVDPKAIWNFGITIAPMHYYSDPTIANDIEGDTGFTAADGFESFDESKGHYGFPFANAEYFNKVIKSRLVPMGAGTYKATTANNYEGNIVVKEGNRWVEKIAKKSTNSGFFGDQIVYYMRNEYFKTTSETGDIQNAKIRLFRYQVVSSNRLYEAVKTGQVYYADPSAKIQTFQEADRDKNIGIAYRKQPNNGYGYIGVNPKYVRDITIRRCIMMAMNVDMCLDFYGSGAAVLYRPMTNNSWAYPKGATSFYNTSALQTDGKFDTDKVTNRIKEILSAAGYTPDSEGTMHKDLGGTVKDFKCKFTFTVAGAESDHPAYATMSHAVDILNECGFDCKLVNDAQALSKLASGTLQVWAAAWSSTIDPDMYQVYHKDSKATSILNWGYDEILGLNGKEPVEYEAASVTSSLWDYANDDVLDADYERKLIDDLSDIIDRARAITDSGEDSSRAGLYHQALDIVMKLAVELPTYQRDNLYVFREDIIDSSTILSQDKISAYQGPIDKIWELEFVK